MMKSIPITLSFILSMILSVSAATDSSSSGSGNNCGLQHLQGTISKYSSYEGAAYPQMDPNYNYGLMSMPTAADVCACTLRRLDIADGVTLPVFETDETQDDPSKVKRIVIVMPAKGRDAWAYFNWMRNARNHAAANFKEVSKHAVAVLSAEYFQNQDYQAGGAKKTDIRWANNNGWADGSPAKYPEGTDAVGMSTFEVLDKLGEYVLKKYPQATSLVYAGHSLGGQMVQRYAVLGRDLPTSVEVSYFMGNPGSYLYLDSDRPVSVSNCKGIDDYKYGLAKGLPDYVQTPLGGKSAFMSKVANRKLDLVIGDDDYGNGDTRCQAEAQGSNHKQRGRLWKDSIEKLYGSWPSKWSYAKAPGCKHDDQCIFNSDAGLQHLFRDGFQSTQSQTDSKKAHKANRRMKTRMQAIH